MSVSSPTRTAATRRTWDPAYLLLAGPVLFFCGYAIHPDLPADTAAALRDLADQRDVYLAAKVAVAVGSLLFVPLVVSVLRRCFSGRGARLATVAAAMCAVGFASNGLSQTLWGYLLYFATAPGVDAAAGIAVVDAGNEAPFVATLPVSFFSIPLLALGILLLAVASWRAGTVPRWVPVTLVLVDLLASAFPIGPVHVLIAAGATVAFARMLNAAPDSVRQ